jgi:hypothetical protein
MAAKYLTPAGIRSPDHPARSESLYQLCYPGPPPQLVPCKMTHLIGYLTTNLPNFTGTSLLPLRTKSSGPASSATTLCLGGPQLKFPPTDQLSRVYSWCYSTPPSKFRDSTLNQATTASFYILSNWLFTDHRTVRCCTATATDSIIK